MGVSWTAMRSNQSILKEINSWIFIARTVAQAEAPILWPPDVKNRLTGEDPYAEKDWKKKKRDDGSRGWDSCTASLTLRTCIWTNSGKQWRSRKADMLQYMELQSDSTEWLNNNKNVLLLLSELTSKWLWFSIFLFSLLQVEYQDMNI